MENFERAKRLIKIVVGFTMLLAGIAMLVLPGPGIVVVTLGLAILAAEFVWARRLLDRLKAAGRTARDVVTKRAAGRRQ
jgi:tellurite resistance protein TerC